MINTGRFDDQDFADYLAYLIARSNYASRDELVEAIKAKYAPEVSKDEDNSIPDGSICVQEEMAMQNQPEEKSFKLNTKPHKPEVTS